MLSLSLPESSNNNRICRRILIMNQIERNRRKKKSLLDFIILFIVSFTCLNVPVASTHAPTVSPVKNYTGHAILRVPISHLDNLLSSSSSSNSSSSSLLQHHLMSGRDFRPEELEILWTTNNNVTQEEEAVIRVPPDHHLHRIVKRRAPHRIMISNLQQWIDTLSLMSSEHSESGGSYSAIVPNFRLDVYHNLDDIYRYIRELSRRSSGVTVFDIGTTHEGRKLKGVEIVGNPDDPSLVWIDGGTHAREWITPAVAIFIMEQAVLSRFPYNLVIIPVMNPDGYTFTWTNDRLWRKNRRPPSGPVRDAACYGVDLNRNYDVAFGGQGSSSNQCSHLYQGPEPLSEPETFATANLIWNIKRQIKMHISLHSFNQLWASPYAHTKSITPDHAIHMDVLKSIQTAVYKSSGVLYSIGPLSTSLYVGSGFAMDWVYSHVGITHTYLAELRDKGYYGFLLPANQIIATSQETWEGIKAGIQKVSSLA